MINEMLSLAGEMETMTEGHARDRYHYVQGVINALFTLGHKKTGKAVLSRTFEVHFDKTHPPVLVRGYLRGKGDEEELAFHGLKTVFRMSRLCCLIEEPPEWKIAQVLDWVTFELQRELGGLWIGRIAPRSSSGFRVSGWYSPKNRLSDPPAGNETPGFYRGFGSVGGWDALKMVFWPPITPVGV